jgi:shikimate dehydrogenase
MSGTALVAEVVMVPELTPLLQAAQRRGLGIVPGREMLTQQVEVAMDFLGMTV